MEGIGFGLGMAVVLDPPTAQTLQASETLKPTGPAHCLSTRAKAHEL
jgi:hypothetical protein